MIVVPNVIRALGTVPKNLCKKKMMILISCEKMRSTMCKKLARIPRRVLVYEENLLSFEFQ